MAVALLSRNQELERTLQGKRAQGYRIESHDDTQAVLLMRGRRRFFNLLRGDEVRYRLSFDERGHASSRRIDDEAPAQAGDHVARPVYGPVRA